MKRKLILFFSILLILSSTLFCSASNLDFGYEKMTGDTSYQISGEGWKSLLEFPLDIKLVTITYQQRFNNDYELGLNYKTNLTEEAGTMKDSDWIYNQKIFYSESKADLNSNFYDLHLAKIKNLDKFRLKSILGYKYNYFDYTIHDGTQWNYLYNSTSSLDGEVLDYQVTYHIPYIGFDISTENKKQIMWNINVNFSPFLSANDRDDHILRSKLSKAETEGTGIFINYNLIYILRKNINLKGNISYSNINTSGNQNQYYYAGDNKGTENNNITCKITSEQLSFRLALELSF